MSDDNAKKRLGRGLAALIGEMDQPLPKRTSGTKLTALETSTSKEPNTLAADRSVPIEHIRANPNNPRRFFSDSELHDLSSSIAKHGIVQPILVRSIPGEDLAGAKFEIIAGERRWRAAQKASVHEVPVVIREVGDAEALELAIIENVQRADLNPIEEALGYQQLIDEYDYSQSDLGNVIGKSRSHVANTLRLLKLPEKVQVHVTSGALSAGHARTLITAKDPARVAERIISGGLSVRQAETLSQADEATTTNVPKGKLETKSADVVAVEKQIEDALGLKTSLSYKGNGSGELRIKFKTLEQLEEIQKRLERK